MKKKSILGALAALALVCSLAITSCATPYQTVRGVMTPVGPLTSSKINEARADDVIASYTILLWYFTSGYEEFLAAVKGKDFDIITEHNFLIATVKAVKRY